MVRQQVPAADLAELAVTSFRLVVDANVAFALGDLHRLGLPEAEGVDRCSRPAPARRAMAETCRGRLAGDGELDGAAETTSFVSLVHGLPFSMRISVVHELVLKTRSCRGSHASAARLRVVRFATEFLRYDSRAVAVDVLFTTNSF